MNMSVILSLLITKFSAEGCNLTVVAWATSLAGWSICFVSVRSSLIEAFLQAHLPPSAARHRAGSGYAVAVSPGGMFNKERQL